MASGSIDLQTAKLYARGIVDEIAKRWPGQAGRWATDKDMVMSWARTIQETGASKDELQRGLTIRSVNPYPPDLPAIIASGRASRFSEWEIKASYIKTVRAVSSGSLCNLNELEWVAGSAWGWDSLRFSGGDSWKTWAELLEKAARHELPVPRTEKPKPQEGGANVLPSFDFTKVGERCASLKDALAGKGDFPIWRQCGDSM